MTTRRSVIVGGAATALLGPILRAGRLSAESSDPFDIKTYVGRVTTPPTSSAFAEEEMRARASAVERRYGSTVLADLYTDTSACYPNFLNLTATDRRVVSLDQTRDMYAGIPGAGDMAEFINDIINIDFARPVGLPPSDSERAEIASWMKLRSQRPDGWVVMEPSFGEAQEVLKSTTSTLTTDEMAGWATHALYGTVLPAFQMSFQADANRLVGSLYQLVAGGCWAILHPQALPGADAARTAIRVARRGHLLVDTRAEMTFRQLGDLKTPLPRLA